MAEKEDLSWASALVAGDDRVQAICLWPVN